MPRKSEEEIKADQVKEDPKEVAPQIVEVPITLELINNKLNYIISKLDQSSNPIN